MGLSSEPRLSGKIAVVVGAGQTPGETIGNGRAISILLARHGAHVVAVDRRVDSAAETCGLIRDEGGSSSPLEADISREADCEKLAANVVADHGRIDVLVNNVGIGTGDGGATSLTEEAWDRIFSVNLKGMWLTCKHVLPVMRNQQGGAIVNISSLAAVAAAPMLAYKTSKAGVNALTQALAIGNAKYGIRVNAVMPGFIDTPMAMTANVEATGIPVEDMRRMRDAAVPLRRKMGTAWDVAHAVLYLASDEANFVTGAILPVDGGQGLRIG
ncbi:MAG: SDR family oxidoreductase [Acidimicrobiales bacterium]|nr:SDR family oxidoreductase [Acidimicrobiales bacterium]